MQSQGLRQMHRRELRSHVYDQGISKEGQISSAYDTGGKDKDNFAPQSFRYNFRHQYKISPYVLSVSDHHLRNDITSYVEMKCFSKYRHRKHDIRRLRCFGLRLFQASPNESKAK
jgi:hypothetical protein